MFNSQFHLIKLYLDFRNKSAFKLGNYLSQHIPISKTPCKFFSTPSSSKAQWFNPHFHFLTGCCSNAETVFPQMSNFHTRTFSTPDVRQHPPGSRTSWKAQPSSPGQVQMLQVSTTVLSLINGEKIKAPSSFAVWDAKYESLLQPFKRQKIVKNLRAEYQVHCTGHKLSPGISQNAVAQNKFLSIYLSLHCSFIMKFNLW